MQAQADQEEMVLSRPGWDAVWPAQVRAGHGKQRSSGDCGSHKSCFHGPEASGKSGGLGPHRKHEDGSRQGTGRAASECPAPKAPLNTLIPLDSEESRQRLHINSHKAM